MKRIYEKPELEVTKVGLGMICAASVDNFNNDKGDGLWNAKDFDFSDEDDEEEE